MNQIIKIAWVCICVLLFLGCFNPEDYDTPLASADKISFISENITNVPADGINTGLVKVRISDKASPGRRTVVFKTSSGFFIGGKGDSIAVTAAESFSASAQLANLNATTAIVTAKIINVTTLGNLTITFVRVYPATISVAVDSFSVAKDYKGETIITATLRIENGGKPSIGHPVQFTVTRPSNPAVGDFLNDKSIAITDADGKAKIRYTPGATEPGYATVTASTIISVPGNSTAQGSTTSAATRIYIR